MNLRKNNYVLFAKTNFSDRTCDNLCFSIQRPVEFAALSTAKLDSLK